MGTAAGEAKDELARQLKTPTDPTLHRYHGTAYQSTQHHIPTTKVDDSPSM